MVKAGSTTDQIADAEGASHGKGCGLGLPSISKRFDDLNGFVVTIHGEGAARTEKIECLSASSYVDSFEQDSSGTFVEQDPRLIEHIHRAARLARSAWIEPAPWGIDRIDQIDRPLDGGHGFDDEIGRAHV